MQKLIKLSNSPFNPNLETFENMVIKLHVPYSSNDVTIQINPNIVGYREKQDSPNMKIRQFSVTIPTEDTKFLKFDFKDNNVHKIQIENNTFEIKLMTIGKENIQGQDFTYFEFFVMKL